MDLTLRFCLEFRATAVVLAVSLWKGVHITFVSMLALVAMDLSLLAA
jgi:hypothetical protein